MAGFLGLAAGMGLKYVGDKYRESQQQDQFYKNLELKSLMELPHTDPNKAFDPGFEKQLTKKMGKEHAIAALTFIRPHAAAALREQKQQQDTHAMLGALIGLPGLAHAAGMVGPTGQAGDINYAPDAQGNLVPATSVQVPPSARAGATAGASPMTPTETAVSASPSAPNASMTPQGTEALDAEQRELEAAQMALDQSTSMTPELRKGYDTLITRHLNEITKKRNRIAGIAAAGDRSSASTRARINEETRPGNVAAEARRAATLSGARTGAEIAARLKATPPEQHFATAQAELASL